MDVAETKRNTDENKLMENKRRKYQNVIEHRPFDKIHSLAIAISLTDAIKKRRKDFCTLFRPTMTKMKVAGIRFLHYFFLSRRCS